MVLICFLMFLRVVTKPYEFTGFRAMDGITPWIYSVRGHGPIEALSGPDSGPIEAIKKARYGTPPQHKLKNLPRIHQQPPPPQTPQKARHLWNERLPIQKKTMLLTFVYRPVVKSRSHWHG